MHIVVFSTDYDLFHWRGQYYLAAVSNDFSIRHIGQPQVSGNPDYPKLGVFEVCGNEVSYALCDFIIARPVHRVLYPT